MLIELELLSIVDILSAATAFMLGLLFLSSKSENRRANIYLGLFLWSLAAEVLDTLIHNFSEETISILQTSLFTIPLLLCYVKTTINKPIKPLFFGLFGFGLLANVFRFSEDINIVEYIFNITLLVYILMLLKQHKQRVNSFYSNLEYKTLKWIQLIVYIFLGFHLLWIIEDIVAFQNEDMAQYFAALSSIFTLFMIYWIGQNGFSQSEIFKHKLFTTEVAQPKTQGPEVSQEDKLLFTTLTSEIKTQKLFINPKLNLNTLAGQLDIKEKELSRLINECAETNFYQFINRFRVDEFKNLIQSPKAKQLSILGLAQEAGFASKSTFYTAFKSLEGMTPKAFESSLK